LRTEQAEPNLAYDLTDIVEPRFKQSNTEHLFLPKLLAPPITLNPLPNRTNDLTLIEEPSWTKSTTEVAEPNLVNDRTEKELPRLNTSSNEILLMEPHLMSPCTLSEEPHLAILRTLNEEDRCTKSHTDIIPPHRNIVLDLSDKLEPKLQKFNIDTDPATLTWCDILEQIDIEDDNLAIALKLIPLPKCTNDNTLQLIPILL
jgi:hypothetical protein